MFAHHVDELRRLASASDAWTQPDPPALPADQRAVRDAVNGRTARPSGEALHDGFFRRAERQPDAPAVLSSSGDLTYGQLRRQALALAAALRDNGIGDGDTVAVVGPKTAEQVPAVLGILAAGGVYLPISVDQPRDRAERILRGRSGEAGPGVRRAAAVVAGARADHRRPAGRRVRRCRVPARGNRSRRACLRVVHLGLNRRAQGRRGHP